MVRIRLRRAGGKGQPTHRIVAANRESPRDGKFIEILGDYNPRTEPATIRVKEDRIYYWLSVGAQPSDAVLQVFGSIGLLERYQRYKDGEDLETLVAEGKEIEKERNVDPRTRRDDLVKVSKPKKVEEPEAEEAPEAEAVEEEAPEAEAPEAVEETPEAAAEEEAAPEAVEETPEEEAEEEAAPEVEAEETPAEEVEEEAPEAGEEEAPAAEVEEEPAPEAAEEKEIKITDAAQKLAEEAGIDISTVEGTGKDGAILKSDITKLIKD
jgi:small subunit ribosomal protein S16